MSRTSKLPKRMMPMSSSSRGRVLGGSQYPTPKVMAHITDAVRVIAPVDRMQRVHDFADALTGIGRGVNLFTLQGGHVEEWQLGYFELMHLSGNVPDSLGAAVKSIGWSSHHVQQLTGLKRDKVNILLRWDDECMNPQDSYARLIGSANRQYKKNIFPNRWELFGLHDLFGVSLAGACIHAIERRTQMSAWDRKEGRSLGHPLHFGLPALAMFYSGPLLAKVWDRLLALESYLLSDTLPNFGILLVPRPKRKYTSPLWGVTEAQMQRLPSTVRELVNGLRLALFRPPSECKGDKRQPPRNVLTPANSVQGIQDRLDALYDEFQAKRFSLSKMSMASPESEEYDLSVLNCALDRTQALEERIYTAAVQAPFYLVVKKGEVSVPHKWYSEKMLEPSAIRDRRAKLAEAGVDMDEESSLLNSTLKWCEEHPGERHGRAKWLEENVNLDVVPQDVEIYYPHVQKVIINTMKTVAANLLEETPPVYNYQATQWRQHIERNLLDLGCRRDGSVEMHRVLELAGLSRWQSAVSLSGLTEALYRYTRRGTSNNAARYKQRQLIEMLEQPTAEYVPEHSPYSAYDIDMIFRLIAIMVNFEEFDLYFFLKELRSAYARKLTYPPALVPGEMVDETGKEVFRDSPEPTYVDVLALDLLLQDKLREELPIEVSEAYIVPEKSELPRVLPLVICGKDGTMQEAEDHLFATEEEVLGRSGLFPLPQPIEEYVNRLRITAPGTQGSQLMPVYPGRAAVISKALKEIPVFNRLVRRLDTVVGEFTGSQKLGFFHNTYNTAPAMGDFPLLLAFMRFCHYQIPVLIEQCFALRREGKEIAAVPYLSKLTWEPADLVYGVPKWENDGLGKLVEWYNAQCAVRDIKVPAHLTVQRVRKRYEEAMREIMENDICS